MFSFSPVSSDFRPLPMIRIPRITPLLALLALPAAAQRTDSATAHAPAALHDVGGTADERWRTAQLLGAAPTDGFLVRSPSSRAPRGRGGTYARVLAPRMDATWNSHIPASVNDGAQWAGRGLSGRISWGVDAAAGPLRLVLAPTLLYAANQPFTSLLPESWDSAQAASFIPPWQTGAHAVDLPYRMGADASSRLDWGESSLVLRAGPVEAGVATESQWWGPGVRNAIVLSNQAGGFPHALLRTSAPLSTPLGSLEARWITGRLSSSPWDTASVGRHRSLSGAAVVLAPAPTVALGAARVVYAPVRDGGSGLGAAADVFVRWRGAGDTLRGRPHEQMISVFGRWVSPADGAEVYAEWARRRLPGSLAELVERPEHTQGYTLGAALARPLRGSLVRFSGEATYLEKSSTYRQLPTGSWYAGRAVPQGYTHRGQVLGASIGPGASGQWLAVDLLGPRAQAGVSLTRVRWANDAYLDKPGGHNRYRAHDVSILGAVRGGVTAGPLWLEAEWQAGRRYNFMFQNFGRDWSERHLTVSPFNHTLRLRVSAAPPRLRLR